MAVLDSVTTIGLEDIPLFLCMATLHALYRLFMERYALRRLAKYLHVAKVEKFTHRCFDLIHYSVSALLGSFAVLPRDYGFLVFWAKNGIDLCYPHTKAFDCSPIEKIYYLNFIVYYCIDFFFVKTQPDWKVIAAHHFACLGLVINVLALKSPEVCFTIMLLHDFVDVPLYFGKVSTYAGFMKGREIGLLLFAILDTWFRMINYPFVVWHCVNIYRTKQLETPRFYLFNVFLLVALYGCHIKWFMDILKAVKGIVTNQGRGAIRDNRSD